MARECGPHADEGESLTPSWTCIFVSDNSEDCNEWLSKYFDLKKCGDGFHFYISS